MTDADQRVRGLWDIAEHWRTVPAADGIRSICDALPHTRFLAAMDYIDEAAGHIDRAAAIRAGADPGAYLTDIDARDLTEAQQVMAAWETADCMARDILVGAVAADDRLGASPLVEERAA